jgi:hypothetical protein
MDPNPTSGAPPLFGGSIPESAEAVAEDLSRSQERLREFFSPLFANTAGIDRWLDEATPNRVFDRLYALDAEPLSRAQLNQLLVLSSEAGSRPASSSTTGCLRLRTLMK